MSKSHRILVTGGAGFIGTNLCNELIKKGHEVVSCDYRERKLYWMCMGGSLRIRIK